MLAKLKREHNAKHDHLARVRRMTRNYHAPEDATPALRELYERLAAFESAVLMHVYAEEHVVIPRAMALARGEHDHAAGA